MFYNSNVICETKSSTLSFIDLEGFKITGFINMVNQAKHDLLYFYLFLGLKINNSNKLRNQNLLFFSKYALKGVLGSKLIHSLFLSIFERERNKSNVNHLVT